MHLSYLDLFLAFIGLTFGVPSALPGVFYGSKDSRPQGRRRADRA